MNRVSIRRAAFAEFLGTFVLVLSISLTLAGSDGASAASVPAAAGLAVLVMIYAVGDLCGAHFNPAVTAGFWGARRFPGDRVLPYWAAQIVGATTAAGFARFIGASGANVSGGTPRPPGLILGVTHPSGGLVEAFLCEAVLAAVLMLVILRVSTGAKAVGVMAGVAVGGTVTLTALIGGPVSGASLNPARSVGPAVAAGDWADLWIYVVAPPVGAFAAVVLDRWLGPPATLDPGPGVAEGSRPGTPAGA